LTEFFSFRNILLHSQISMSLKRRDFLWFLTGMVGSVAAGSLQSCDSNQLQIFSQKTPKRNFVPVKGPMPLRTDGIEPAQQMEAYKTYEVLDDVVLPEGFTYQVLAVWGDKVGNSRFGYNNDYLSFIETAPNEGYLTINFEYISDRPWIETYQQVIGKSLPFAAVGEAFKKANQPEINAFALQDKNPLKAQIREICTEALIDQGMGVISVRRSADGTWERTNSPQDRRITGLSGFKDGNYLKATGPAVAIFQKKQGQGYLDQLGDKIIGTFANCAGGTTPWGTVLSGEENFQSQVAEAVYADGTPNDPGTLPFNASLDGQGNIFGLAGHKYGWIVEVDPANSKDYGTKHTWLGRYRHEAVGVRVEAGKPLAFYSGCDRQGGHLYKFVSQDVVKNPTDKANSQLLSNGMLYGAKFNPDGTGTWVPLKPDTPVDPQRPSQLVGNAILLPERKTTKDKTKQPASYLKVEQDAALDSYKKQFKTLGDLYTGTATEKQGAILIDAHYAANAAGITCTARPEDTEVAPDGSLYITFTAGTSAKEGGPDQTIFKGPNGETPYLYGWVMQLTEDNNEPAAMKFTWKMAATGGEPDAGGIGFSNPDNLLIDPAGNIWIVTDMSGGSHNVALPTRKTEEPPKLMGLFGNNSIWYMPTSGEDAGKAFLFGFGPMECETTGPCFTPDQQTLFLAIQHPGEVSTTRKDMASEVRQYAMLTVDGQEFLQTRLVPVGSNWPGKGVNDPPKPAVVVIRRTDNQAFV
jgi:secreted PhoX family phosphatase